MFAPAGAGKRLRHSHCVICANISLAIRNMMSKQHHISANLFDNTRKTSVSSRRFTDSERYVCTNKNRGAKSSSPRGLPRETIIYRSFINEQNNDFISFFC